MEWTIACVIVLFVCATIVVCFYINHSSSLDAMQCIKRLTIVEKKLGELKNGQSAIFEEIAKVNFYQEILVKNSSEDKRDGM